MDIAELSGAFDLQKQVAVQNTQNKTDSFKTALEKASQDKDDVQLKSACDQLETYMLTQVYKQMKKSMLTGDSLFGKSDYETTFEDYLLQAQCEEMVKAGGIGLSDSMYKQISTMYSNSAASVSENQETSPVIDETL